MRMATKDNQASEPTLGELVSDLTQQVTGIAKAEIELALTEVKKDVTNAAVASVEFVVAGVLALFGLGLLLTAAAWGLVAVGLPAWAGFLIIAGALFLAVGILVLLGIRKIKKVKGKPARAIAQAQHTVEAIKPSKASAEAPTGATKAAAATR